MAQALYPYEISQEADNDLGDIFDYTVDKFGLEQAIKYVSGLEDVFKNICCNQELGRLRDEIWKGLRSVSKESHTVFYRILEDRIRIVRILHGSRDVMKFLPPKD